MKILARVGAVLVGGMAGLVAGEPAGCLLFELTEGGPCTGLESIPHALFASAVLAVTLAFGAQWAVGRLLARERS